MQMETAKCDPITKSTISTDSEISNYAIVGGLRLNLPEYSDWKCHCFGSRGDGITWTPLKGKEPNRFWRWMQFLCFGNRWVKQEKP